MTTNTTTNTTPKAAIPFTVAKVGLPLFEGKPDVTFAGYTEGHAFQHLVPKKRFYVADRDFVREYRSWHNAPGEFGFMVVGPTGSGKTTSPQAINAMLNIPTLTVSCRTDMRLSELLLTQHFETDPETKQTVSKFVLGPVARAFKFGLSVILDEYNALEPGEQLGLNEIIRGDTMHVPETGEVIHRHPMFRFIVCGNDWGRGEGEMRYAGINQQNAATLNRFWKFELGYPEADVEAKIIKGYVPKGLSDEIINGMVAVAGKVRAVCSGVGKSREATMDVDFSTRTVMLWADTAVRFRKSPGALRLGLDIALLRSLNDVERANILQACEDTFGSDVFGSQSV